MQQEGNLIYFRMLASFGSPVRFILCSNSNTKEISSLKIYSRKFIFHLFVSLLCLYVLCFVPEPQNFPSTSPTMFFSESWAKKMLTLFVHCFHSKYTSLKKEKKLRSWEYSCSTIAALGCSEFVPLATSCSKHSIRHRLTSFVCEDDGKEKGTKVVREWLIKKSKGRGWWKR
jgi:hypothetical protein